MIPRRYLLQRIAGSAAVVIICAVVTSQPQPQPQQLDTAESPVGAKSPVVATVHFREKSVVIAGLAKAVSEHDQSNLALVRIVATTFASTRVIVYENAPPDPHFQAWQTALGTDITVDLLLDESMDLPPAARKHRLARLAYGRNRVLKHVESLPQQPDYLMVVDMDGVNSNLTGIKTCELLPKGWGGCCVNSRELYYDLWALRTLDEWTNCDVYNECKTPPFCGRDKQCLVDSRFRHISSTAKPIEVLSCFGGAAIYDWRTVRGAVYSSKSKTPHQQCEHVAFHETVREQNPNFTLFINPSMLNDNPAQHVSDQVQRAWNDHKAAHPMIEDTWVFPIDTTLRLKARPALLRRAKIALGVDDALSAIVVMGAVFLGCFMLILHVILKGIENK